MAKDGLLQRFIGTRPLSVMTRCILDEMMTVELDDVFEENRSRQYQREVRRATLPDRHEPVLRRFICPVNPAPNPAASA